MDNEFVSHTAAPIWVAGGQMTQKNYKLLKMKIHFEEKNGVFCVTQQQEVE